MGDKPIQSSSIKIKYVEIKMKNHYIQKKFIETFCGTNGILVYNILEDKFLPKLEKANSIALENNLYHFKNIDYPDEQIEKDLKTIEDIGLDIIRTIAKTEQLPSVEDLSKLLAYLYYQSLRTPSQMEALQEEIRKFNKVCNTTVFDDLPIYRIYNEKTSIKAINSLLSEYNLYLLKQAEPIFFITDCFCSALQSKLAQIIPITSYLALYLIPKNSNQIVKLSLKENISNPVSFEEYLALMSLSAFNYRQFAFASYTDLNRKLVPTFFKLLQYSAKNSF